MMIFLLIEKILSKGNLSNIINIEISVNCNLIDINSTTVYAISDIGTRALREFRSH